MPESPDHFALLGLPRSYLLNRQQLEAQYEKLTLEHHPDFFATAGAEAQRNAEETSARINRAYKTLLSDLARADYLLELYHAGRERDTRALPGGFLQEMFLLQEEVDELGEDASPEQRAPLRAQCLERLKTVKQQRATLFGEAEGHAADPATGNGTPPEDLLAELQANLNSERYLQRLLDRL